MQSTGFEITTHVETLEKLKELNLSLIDGLYLGDPTCMEYPTNLSLNIENLKEAVFYAKEFGKKVYLSTFAVPRNKHLKILLPLLEEVLNLEIDGIEVHNMGLLKKVHEMGFRKIHMGFFSNIYTHETVKVLSRFGVVRVFLNPELSMEEIQYINEHSPAEVAVFAHGKLPLGISESCFIREYSQPTCQSLCEGIWLSSGKWKLKNIGFATLSGKDWSVLEYLGTFYYRGFRHFHIQGLRETSNYINTIAGIYRRALEKIEEGIDNYIETEWIDKISELCPAGLCNGYLFRRSGHRYIGRFFGGETIHEIERRERHEAR